MRILLPYLFALLILVCAACRPASTPLPSTPSLPAATVPASPTATSTTAPTATRLPPSPSPTPSAGLQVCSPLQGFTFAQLPAAVSNPYHPPAIGKDDPHAGVDLADRLNGSGMALEGRLVQAALAGQVAAVIKDRFPFGNAVMVETPLESLPAGWLAKLALPTPAPTPQTRPALTCPGQLKPAWNTQHRSLYLLYAHLKSAPALEIGKAVGCGQTLGAVGMSGNALNPHLHLEARLGPADTRFPAMAHYANDATAEEMENYCLWSVSGWFQLLDPLRLFAEAP